MVIRGESFRGGLCAPDASDAELLGAVAAHYATGLARSPAALAWLGERGIGPGPIGAFGLGYADRSLGLVLPEKNRKAGAVLRARLTDLGVLRSSGHEHLRGCVTVPVRDTEGAVVQLAGHRVARARDERGIPATLSLPGQPAACGTPPRWVRPR